MSLTPSPLGMLVLLVLVLVLAAAFVTSHRGAAFLSLAVAGVALGARGSSAPWM